MDWLQYDFMQRALAAGLLVGAMCPLMGVFLILRRYSYMADTLSHVSLAGVAGAAALGYAPGVGALAGAVLGAAGIERLRETGRLRGETILAMFVTGALAVAVILTHYGAGGGVDLVSYLFGSILTVTGQDLWLMGGATLLNVAGFILLGKELLAVAFDEDGARVTGIPVRAVSLVFSLMTALAIAMALRAVGVLLVGALMVIPAASAFQVAHSFRHACIWAVVFGMTSVIAGLMLAYYAAWPAGPAVVIAALAVFVLTLPFSSRR